MTFVIDASAGAEVLFRTPAGERTLEIIGNEPLVAPELLDAEVLSFIRRKTLQRVVTARRAQQAVEMLEAWPIERLSHRPLLAAAFALRDNVNAYDAFYVAAAIAVDGVILTVDGPLARAPVAVDIRDVSVG